MSFISNIHRRRFLGRAMGACILCVTGCTSSTSARTGTTRLTLSAAASMQDVLAPLQAAYKASNPEIEITYNFGSSGSLAQQIIQGAPVDLFLSASSQWLDILEEKDQILPNSRQKLVQNSMVLVVPKDRQDITSFQQLLTVNKIAIGKPDSVPAGRYAKEVLTSMELFERLQSTLVFGKNVRHVLSYVETGNVDAGLVYGTDALTSERIRLVAMAPPHSHSDIVYGAAVVKGSEQPGLAQALIDFLQSESAAAIFREYGFATVAP